MIVAGDPSTPRRSVPFQYSEVKRLLGVDIPRDEGEAILRRLGFGLEDGRAFVPSWRPDIQVKADIVEQILRIAGVDRAPPAALPRLDDGVPKPVLTLLQKRTRLAKRTLAALSLREAVTWSFISKASAELFGGGARALALANPIAADLSDMRPSLIPGLVAAAERNARRGLGDVALFEVGQVFLGEGENDQRIAAAAVRRGRAKAGEEAGIGTAAAWSTCSTPSATRWRCSRRSASTRTRSRSSPAARPSCIRAARRPCSSGPKRSWAGSDNCTRACEALDAEGPIVAFEITLDAIPAPKAKPTKTKPKLDRSEFMAGRAGSGLRRRRDGQRRRHRQGGGERRTRAHRQVGVFDVYRGEGVAEGDKSVAIHVTLQPRERTLTDAEIEAAIARIVAEVAKKTGATLRS